jgi:tetratricopeptide (TPR) repeat protein
LAVACVSDPDPAHNRLREAIVRGRLAELKELAASGEIDRLRPSTVTLLAGALARADAKPVAVEVLRNAQQQHSDDVWLNLALGGLLFEEPETREEAIGFCRMALACRPDSIAIHVMLGDALQRQERPHQAAAVLRRAARLNPDSPWVHLRLGEVLVSADRGPEALDEWRRAVQLKRRLDPQALPDADRFREAERLVDLDDRLPSVLSGDLRPRDAAELAGFADVCYIRGLCVAAARMFGEAFDAQPVLAREHRYSAAWAAVIAGLDKGKDAGAVDEQQWERLRGQGLVWLRDELDTWRRRLGKGSDDDRADVLQRVNDWLRDPDVAGVRDPEPLGRLPAAERREWEKLWRDLRELRASAQKPNKS